ncbi:MAG: DUF4402 domain-containing protein [Bacteroidia bacterium]|nr:DUF4402 domain-containing protein [Bacteroidia bacterium]
MKKLKLITLGITSFLAFASGGATAQVTAAGHIFAEVIDAITAFESSPMNFGRFSTGDQGGSIVIPASGAAVSTSSVITTDSEINPATFSVSGAKDATFSVTLPEGPTTLTSHTGDTMTVTDWTATSGKGDDAYILAGGIQTVKVGATLQVGSINDNPKGIYTGSYKVTFAYN